MHRPKLTGRPKFCGASVAACRRSNGERIFVYVCLFFSETSSVLLWPWTQFKLPLALALELVLVLPLTDDRPGPDLVVERNGSYIVKRPDTWWGCLG